MFLWLYRSWADSLKSFCTKFCVNSISSSLRIVCEVIRRVCQNSIASSQKRLQEYCNLFFFCDPMLLRTQTIELPVYSISLSSSFSLLRSENSVCRTFVCVTFPRRITGTLFIALTHCVICGEGVSSVTLSSSSTLNPLVFKDIPDGLSFSNGGSVLNWKRLGFADRVIMSDWCPLPDDGLVAPMEMVFPWNYLFVSLKNKKLSFFKLSH